MAKSINVSGRMSVERFNDEFQKAFGVRCNVKISKWVNADGKATLASIRPKDFKGPSKVDLSIVGNMTVGTLKKRFEENFGVMIELYIGRKIAPDDVTIGAIREGRAKASKGEKINKTQSEQSLEKDSQPKSINTSESPETTTVKIEIIFEEHTRAVNVLDVPFDKKIDISNFNSDSYSDIIEDEEFIKKAKASIEGADDWRYDLYQTDLEMMGQDYYDDLDKDMSLDYIKNCMDAGDYLIIRIVGVGDKDLSFLSISRDNDEKNENHENFLKGTVFETKLTDEDFEDFYNERMSVNLLALEYVLNYEG
ncbi:MAG: hypothetical protein QGG04_02090 [Candidatus Marinimicrobia bacterium]|nr:hypothetical protein [Candidatus Neomarinimicrobiota bacterium]